MLENTETVRRFCYLQLRKNVNLCFPGNDKKPNVALDKQNLSFLNANSRSLNGGCLPSLFISCMHSNGFLFFSQKPPLCTFEKRLSQLCKLHHGIPWPQQLWIRSWTTLDSVQVEAHSCAIVLKWAGPESGDSAFLRWHAVTMSLHTLRYHCMFAKQV